MLVNNLILVYSGDLFSHLLFAVDLSTVSKVFNPDLDIYVDSFGVFRALIEIFYVDRALFF